MTRPRLRAAPLAALAAVAVALAAGLTVGGPAQAATKPALPVPYTFLTSAVIAGLGIDADPPGANDWSCKPSAAHPRPVVLVHGLTGKQGHQLADLQPPAGQQRLLRLRAHLRPGAAGH